MVIIELSPDDVHTFDIEDMPQYMQPSTVLSCSNTDDDSVVPFEVTSKWPFWYTISPSTGFFLQMNQACLITEELAN
jgi:hypothetical protein